MDKIFKRTLLGAAVATIAMAGSANAAVPLAGDAVQFYGQAAGFMILGDDNENKSASAVIESRIGFRGVVEFEDFGPNLIWQMEGGNADNGAKTGGLGARDTYLGLDFDGVGSFKYGRQLVAAYNYVDWPHSNPGLGNVFDWNNDIGASYQDRADGVFRFDSASWGGFGLQATLSGMSQDTERMVASVGASFSTDTFTIHGGYYSQGKYDSKKDEVPKYIIDENGNVIANPDYVAGGEIVKNDAQNYGIIGGNVNLGSLTLTAAYKAMEKGDAKQNAVSATAQYVLDGKWVFKGGYAMTDDATDKADSGDTALTARLGYLLPSTYLYTDLRNYKMNNADKWSSYLLVGAEYYF